MLGLACKFGTWDGIWGLLVKKIIAGVGRRQDGTKAQWS